VQLLSLKHKQASSDKVYRLCNPIFKFSDIKHKEVIFYDLNKTLYI